MFRDRHPPNEFPAYYDYEKNVLKKSERADPAYFIEIFI